MSHFDVIKSSQVKHHLYQNSYGIADWVQYQLLSIGLIADDGIENTYNQIVFGFNRNV